MGPTGQLSEPENDVPGKLAKWASVGPDADQTKNTWKGFKRDVCTSK